MVKLGVIVKQDEPIEGVNSITVVRKPNKIRICLDPTKLNQAILRSACHTRSIEEVLANTTGARFFSVLDASRG